MSSAGLTTKVLPSYLQLYPSRELATRASRAGEILENCRLCPRAHRLSGEVGFCRSGAAPWVYKYKVHFGDEPPISQVKHHHALDALERTGLGKGWVQEPAE